MKIIILGGGSIGSSIAKELSSEENDVVVIDNNKKNLEALEPIEGIKTICGNGSSPKTLSQSGLDNDSLFLCLTDSEETNLLASIVGKHKYNAGRIVCRLKGSEYRKIAKEITPFVDYFINPEDLITDEINSLLHHPGSLEILDFAEGSIKLVSVRAKTSGLLVGRQIKELKDDLPDYETRIPAIYRDDELFIPTGETVINNGDEVFFIADEKHISDVTRELQKLESKYKNIYIAGAGNIGKSLAKKINEDFNVKLIEKSEEQSELANEALNNVLVLNADAADKDFLDSESIQDCDVFVAVTHDDESNVLCSLMAKKLGSKKTVTIINNEAYFDLVGKNELDIIISPVQITVSHILKYIRKGTVSNVHKVKKGKAEAIELLIDDGVKNIAGKTVEDLKLNENINIPCIKRDEGILMAHGTTEILDNDHLIVFYKNKDDIEDFYNRYK